MNDAVGQVALVRIVRMAQGLEDALEGLSRQLVDALDAETADRLRAHILEKGPAHSTMRSHADSLEGDLAQWLEGMRREEILQALMDTERAAHDAYRSMLDQVRDGDMAAALMGVMREEAQHAAAVEEVRKGR